MKNKKIYTLLLICILMAAVFGCENKEGTPELPSDVVHSGIKMPKPGNGKVIKYQDLPKTENNEDADVEENSAGEAVEAGRTTTPLYEKVSYWGCGDNIIYYGNIRDAKKLSDGSREYNFKPVFKNLSDKIQNADISFINQETVMAGDGYDISYYPRFNSPRDLGYDLCELGFDVVNIANNHMLDKGAAGLSKTIEFWKQQPCLMIGGYENAEDYDNLRIIEKNGIRIAFLSYTWFTNGLSKPASSPLAIPYTKDEDMVRQCKKAKEQAEFIIVSVHWGDEGSFKPNSDQRRIAQLLADNGADVIVGHHPHVIQPVEWINGKSGTRTLCVYSLGNFAAEQAYAYNMLGGTIEFDIVSENNGKPYVSNPVFTPTVFHFDSGFYNNTVYPLSEYTKELASSHGVRGYYKNAFGIDILEKYVENCIAPEFLPVQ